MNEARMKSILANASAISKKVYDSVPVATSWSKVEIHNDMVRRNVGSRDMRMTEGCLMSLKQAGLIAEPKIGCFVRTKVKAKTVKNDDFNLEVVKDSIQLPDESKEDPIELLADLAQKAKDLGHQAKIIGGEIISLSASIEDTALEIEVLSSTKDEEYSKLVQLKTLLKDLG